MGRARNLSVRTKLTLDVSAGILAFLFMDVSAGALGIVETRLEAFGIRTSLWPVIGLFALLSVGFLARWAGSRRPSGVAAARRRRPDRRRRSTATMTASGNQSVFGGEALRTGMVSPRRSGCTTSPRAGLSASRPGR